MPDTTAADPLTPSRIRGMVRTIEPAWSVLDAQVPVHGTDAVCYVTARTGDGPRELVLKARHSVDPPSFRPEPYLLDAIDRRTAIPVPGVVGAVDDADGVPAHRDDLPTPFFLMECCSGHTYLDEVDGVPTRVRERIAREAGRHLGQIHDLGSFDGFGEVRLRRDAGGGRGLVGPGYALTVEDGANDDWPAQFRGLAEYFLARIGDRFADLEPAIREYLDEHRHEVPGDVAPALTHNDYRFWNLLVDRDTGETSAVLDFGNEFTAHGEYNLVGAIDRLGGWAPLGSDRRERVREAITERYAETTDFDRRGFAEYRDLYRLATRLPALVWFEDWTAATPGLDADEMADRHREFVRAIVD